MKDAQKTKAQLIDELAELRLKVAALESVDTRCRQAEEALRESEFTLNNFFDHSQEFMGIIDVLDEEHDLRYVRLNKAAVQYINISPETIKGMLASQVGVSENVQEDRYILSTNVNCQTDSTR
jgi:PAS domain-containing protein